MKENKEKRVTFRLETKDLSKLSNIAKKQDVSVSSVIRDAVKEAIKNENK